MGINAVTYEVERIGGVVRFKGVMRLRDQAAYQQFDDALMAALEDGGDEVTWNLTELEMLNSPGINMLYQFVLKLRAKGDLRVNAVGNRDSAWQAKIFRNMKRLMPSIHIELR